MNVKKINTEAIEKRSNAILKANPILFRKLEELPIDACISPSELLREVIKFMYLVAIYDVKLTPSLIVDYGWHEFILFTKLYHKFCEQELGKFIHHTPDDSKRSNNRNYLKTIQHYIYQFGKPPIAIWGEMADKEWKGNQCGSCQSN